MIESVLRYQRAVAREVMLPRPMVATVDSSWDLETLQRFIATTPHSRFPVVAGSPDDIVGVLHAKHLLRLEPGQAWTDVIVPAHFIPESRPLSDLLQDFRRTGRHIALVLDEFGGFSGVVTLEDVLELLVGEIEDEFDLGHEAVVEAMAGGWSVAGHLSLRRLESLLHRTVARPEDVDSVGGLVGHLLPGDAEVDTVVTWDGLKLDVQEVEDGRPTRVLVSRVQLDAR
jgi:magnesium and cobalt transporter